jgi:hypothetical protein
LLILKNWILTSLLIVVASASFLVAVVLYRENQALSQELSRRMDLPSPEPESIAEEPLPVSAPRLEPAPVPPVAVEPGAAPSRPGWEDRVARFRRMMDDPDVQAAMRERSKSGIEQRYAGLFRSLGLDEETIEVFKELMAEKEMTRRRTAIDLRLAQDGAGPDVAFLAELEMERLDQSLAEVLGEDNYETFAYYQETLPQRQVVDELTRRLSYSGTPLNEEVAEQLVGVMAGTQESFAFTNDLSRMSGWERASLSAEDVALYLEERRILNEAVLSEASTVLAPDQLEALAEQQMREIETLEREAAIGMGMLGGRGPGGGGRGPGGG